MTGRDKNNRVRRTEILIVKNKEEDQDQDRPATCSHQTAVVNVIVSVLVSVNTIEVIFITVCATTSAIATVL